MAGLRPRDRNALLGAADGTARLIFYALVAITLMALDSRGQYVDRIQHAAASVIEPLFLAVDLPLASIRRLTRNMTARQQLLDRVAKLELDLMQTRAEVSRSLDLREENAGLRDLLGATRRTVYRFIPAELASIDLDPFAHRIMVRRGQRDGILIGMPVMDDLGLIGQVDQVLGKLSRVILISDPDHALPVQILPQGERTIAYGSGSLDELRLNDLPMNTRINENDLVVTSGLGGRFPSGLPVGRVHSIERTPGRAFATARVRTLSNMDRNRIVLIIQTPGEPELEPEPTKVADEHSEQTRPPSSEQSPEAGDSP
ncbi:MAG: rod shape-determining protein MreC [Xanthomonadaceae bacterium]|nr:rod shape-determining protein MreC [Xanthomonadaceae bacterium]